MLKDQKKDHLCCLWFTVDKEEKIKISTRNRTVDGYPNEKVLQEFLYNYWLPIRLINIVEHLQNHVLCFWAVA